MKKIIFTLLAIVCTIATNAETTYTTEKDLAYRSNASGYAGERCTVDVYHQTEATACPTVVWFHGGGLEGGAKEIPTELTDCGMVVVGVNYRLLPKCTIDDCIDDAAAAIAWAYRNAERFGGDRGKLFVAGHSAGGYLIDMVTLNKKWLAKYDLDPDTIIAGAFPFSGQCITHFNVRKQKGLQPLQPTIDEYAPLYWVRNGCPPMVIISGDRNIEIFGRYEEQAYLYRMLKLNGNDNVYLYELQGHDHGKMMHPAFHILKEHIKTITNSK